MQLKIEWTKYTRTGIDHINNLYSIESQKQIKTIIHLMKADGEDQKTKFVS